VPKTERLPASLYTDVKIVSGMLLQAGYDDEAKWLWMAVTSPPECGSVLAKAALRNVAQFAEQQGFGAVARWIEGEVL
jgi:hypothetical protein